MKKGKESEYKNKDQQRSQQWPQGRGVREFIRILKLCRRSSISQVSQAVAQALEYGCVHADGVELCLHQLLSPERSFSALKLVDQPSWATVGTQPLNLGLYEQLLEQV